MFKEPKTQLERSISFRKHMPVEDDKGDKSSKNKDFFFFGKKTKQDKTKTWS